MNRTNIQWTDFTSNPIRYKNADGLDVWACSKVSAGCQHCYAETLALSPRMVSPGRALGNKFNDAEMAKLTPYLDEAELVKILKAKPRGPFRNGDRPMVFLGDMTDIFGEWVSDEMLDRVFAAMALRPHITYQVLTKRPERMRAYMGEAVKERWFAAAKDMVDSGQMTSRDLNRRAWVPNGEPTEDADGQIRVRYTTVFHRFPLPNVWLGTSVENQEAADLRIPDLLATPAAVRFLSCEPLLGQLDLEEYLSRLDWLIVGGESGIGARPCDVVWIRNLISDCAVHAVPIFVKQLGSKPQRFSTSSTPDQLRFKHGHGGDPAEWPEDMRVREFPAAAS